MPTIPRQSGSASTGNVTEVRNRGADGVELRPDDYILDLDMPGIDGFELATGIRAGG